MSLNRVSKSLKIISSYGMGSLSEAMKNRKIATKVI